MEQCSESTHMQCIGIALTVEFPDSWTCSGLTYYLSPTIPRGKQMLRSLWVANLLPQLKDLSTHEATTHTLLVRAALEGITVHDREHSGTKHNSTTSTLSWCTPGRPMSALHGAAPASLPAAHNHKLRCSHCWCTSPARTSLDTNWLQAESRPTKVLHIAGRYCRKGCAHQPATLQARLHHPAAANIF